MGWKNPGGKRALGGLAGKSSAENSSVSGKEPPAHSVPSFPGSLQSHLQRSTDLFFFLVCVLFFSECVFGRRGGGGGRGWEAGVKEVAKEGGRGRRFRRKKKKAFVFLLSSIVNLPCSPVLLGRGLGHEAKGLVPAPCLPLLGEAAEGEGGHRLNEWKKGRKKGERESIKRIEEEKNEDERELTFFSRLHFSINQTNREAAFSLSFLDGQTTA